MLLNTIRVRWLPQPHYFFTRCFIYTLSGLAIFYKWRRMKSFSVCLSFIFFFLARLLIVTIVIASGIFIGFARTSKFTWKKICRPSGIFYSLERIPFQSTRCSSGTILISLTSEFDCGDTVWDNVIKRKYSWKMVWEANFLSKLFSTNQKDEIWNLRQFWKVAY